MSFYDCYCEGCDANLGTLNAGPDFTCKDCGAVLCSTCDDHFGLCRVCEEEIKEKLYQSSSRLKKAFLGLIAASKKHTSLIPEHGSEWWEWQRQKNEIEGLFEGVISELFPDDLLPKKLDKEKKK